MPDIIDRHPSHGFIWLMLVLHLVLILMITVVAASEDAALERRVKALESGCALDVEVQDLKKRIEVLEGKR